MLVTSAALYQPFPMLEHSSAQVWQYSPQCRRPRHFHSEPELNVVVAGTATFGVGRRVKVLHAGEVLGFTPGQDHELIGGSSDLVLFAIGLGRALASEVLPDGGERVLSPLHARLGTGELAALVSRCAKTSGLAHVEQGVAELWQAAHWACRRTERTTPAPHALTRRALSAIEHAPDRDRAALAASTRGCPSELARHFSRDLGLTLVEYRARVRLLRFIERVDRGGSLTAAALDAGFGSYSQCHRVFQRSLGCAPSAFFQTELRRRIEDAFVPGPAADPGFPECDNGGGDQLKPGAVDGEGLDVRVARLDARRGHGVVGLLGARAVVGQGVRAGVRTDE